MSNIVPFLSKATQEEIYLEARKRYEEHLTFLAWDAIGLSIGQNEDGSLYLIGPDLEHIPFDPWNNFRDLLYAIVVGRIPVVMCDEFRSFKVGSKLDGPYDDEVILDKDLFMGHVRISVHMYAREMALDQNEYMRKADGLLFEGPE